MRLLILFFLGIPCISFAQVNRSASEFAKEKIQEFIVSKIFIEGEYRPLSFGELLTSSVPGSRHNWSMLHQFEIVDSQYVSNKRMVVHTSYYFSFYLDKKLNVLSAIRFGVE